MNEKYIVFTQDPKPDFVGFNTFEAAEQYCKGSWKGSMIEQVMGEDLPFLTEELNQIWLIKVDGKEVASIYSVDIR